MKAPLVRVIGWPVVGLLLACSSGSRQQPAPQPAAPTASAPQTTAPRPVVTATPAPVASSQVPDTIQPGRFDTGKMWLFENPPLAYFQEAYGFTPSPEWLKRARLSALRLPNCSASFVS